MYVWEEFVCVCCMQLSSDGQALVHMTAPAYGLCTLTDASALGVSPIMVTSSLEGITVDNGVVRVTIHTRTGAITRWVTLCRPPSHRLCACVRVCPCVSVCVRVCRLVYVPLGREVVSHASPANSFVLYQDIPFYW